MTNSAPDARLTNVILHVLLTDPASPVVRGSNGRDLALAISTAVWDWLAEGDQPEHPAPPEHEHGHPEQHTDAADTRTPDA